jgi:hypothetical protein
VNFGEKALLARSVSSPVVRSLANVIIAREWNEIHIIYIVSRNVLCSNRNLTLHCAYFIMKEHLDFLLEKNEIEYRMLSAFMALSFFRLA